VAFNPNDYNIEQWLSLEESNMLQKICSIYDDQGRLTEEKKTRVHVVPVGYVIPDSSGRISRDAPCLRRTFLYDEFDNPTATVPTIVEWGVACEEASHGALPPTTGNPSGIVEFGIKVSKLNNEFNEITNLVNGVETLLLRKTLLPDEVIYMRSLRVSGDSRAEYYIKIDGVPLDKRRLWWTQFNDQVWFETADGGIMLSNEAVLEVFITNTGEGPADFNASVDYTKEPE